jgi:hypothetical protein
MGQVDQKMMDAYRRLGLAAMKIVYDKAISRQLIDMMGQSEPPQSIADAALVVLGQLKEKAQGIEPAFVYSVGPAVISFIAELGEAAGLFKRSPEMLKQVAMLISQKLKAQEQGASPQQPPPPAAGMIPTPQGA